jgi:hypothetical protein
MEVRLERRYSRHAFPGADMRIAIASFAVVVSLAISSTARADLPKVGDFLAWPTMKAWLGDPPSQADAAGKIVVHWFCSPKTETCADDLGRIVGLREAGRVYIVAYIAGTKKQAKRLDPVREEVGGGAVSYGAKPVQHLMSSLGLPAGGSIVVDVDGRVAYVSSTSQPDVLDARDTKISSLVSAIKEFTVGQSGPKEVKVGAKFTLDVSVDLASWLTFSKKAPTELVLGPPPGVTCTTKLTASDLKIEGRKMSGSFSCTAQKKGVYETRATLRFGYDHPAGATGVGSDSVKWKFEAKP